MDVIKKKKVGMKYCEKQSCFKTGIELRGFFNRWPAHLKLGKSWFFNHLHIDLVKHYFIELVDLSKPTNRVNSKKN